MYSSLFIASKFIQLGITQEQPITPMKLQKLLYMAHGIHLANYDKPLLNEPIEAWSYGPVIPVVYQNFKQWGNTPITEAPRLYLTIGERTYTNLDTLDNETEMTIGDAWATAKDFDAIQLSEWSHKAGSPWAQSYNGPAASPLIPDERIKAYFQKLMQPAVA